jgi:hypothetical protein
MSYELNRRSLPASKLNLVASADSFPRTAPRIGKTVKLNSGSPPMLIVDHDGDHVTVSWTDDGEIHEATFSNICLKDDV